MYVLVNVEDTLTWHTVSMSSSDFVNINAEKRGLTWLTALPLDEFGLQCIQVCFPGHSCPALQLAFPLHSYALCLWSIFLCWASFIFPKGWLPCIRHNDMRDLTTTLLTEVCSQVATECELQSVSQEELSLSSLYRMAPCWILLWMVFRGRSKRAFVHVFSPFSPSNGANS